ncbi:MAG TPA: energy transducer TonB [Saprospiraceae bacterium]|nr:energy transducer TonB [Saprospiraceae bacterium]
MTYLTRNSFLLALMICALHISLSAQTPIDEAVRSADLMPSLPGCEPKMIDECSQAKLAEFLAANIVIPEGAKTQGAGGLVMVEFVVEKNGKIGEVRTLHDPGFGLGEEAIRVVKLMNDKKIVWSAAREKGKKVAYRYITPVPFHMSAPPRELPKKMLEPEKVYSPKIYDVVDVRPQFAGCVRSEADTVDCTFMKMLNHIQTNLKYPEEALSLRVTGPVVVDFIVDSSGHVTAPVVKKSLGHGTDEEALRVISLMPAWTPGMVEGRPVAVRMTIPILFQIPKEKEKE